MDDITEPKIGIIVGSNRTARIGLSIAEWLQGAIKTDGLKIKLIDLASVNLPYLDEPKMPALGNYQNEGTKAWSETIKSYDGFVLLFPQYNWGYPAVIKNALDYLYDEWAGKPVSIVSYGNHGGFQGYIAMRLVTQGLHMQTMTANIPLDIEDGMFDESGKFIDINTALEPYKYSAQMVSQEFLHLLKQPI
jgi:NAD(P)H-dependent FMN reductase